MPTMPDMGGGLLAGAVWTPPIAVLQRGPAVLPLLRERPVNALDLPILPGL